MAQAQDRQTALADRIEEKIDRGYAREITLLGAGAGAMFVPQSIGEIMEFSKMMAVAAIAIPKHLRGNPGACMAVSMQAFRWGFDPFAVALKSYLVNDIIAYEAQLINSVVNTLAPIKARPLIDYEGEGQERVCIVSAVLIGEDEPRVIRSPKIKDISPKNSPLWKNDPDQQLAYYTTRTWARRYVPEVLLGVYAEDEIDNFKRSEQARDVTPKAAPAAPAAPTRQDFEKKAEVIDVPTDDNSVPSKISEIESALAEATTASELTEVWTVAGRDGDLDAIRRHSPAESSRLATIYNTRHLEFEEARIELEQEADASDEPAGGSSNGSGEGDEPGTDDPDEARMRLATAYAAQAGAELANLGSAKAINAWLSTTFRANAEKKGLSEGQIARVEKAAQERIAALEAK